MGHDNLEDVGTHSLKATVLAWTASFGTDLDIQSLLGYHVPQSKMSALTYSRAAMSAPLRHMITVLTAIREKRFLPDRTRSGLFVAENSVDQLSEDEIPAAQQDPVHHSDDAQSADGETQASDSGSDSSDDDSEDSEVDQQVQITLKKGRAKAPAETAGCDAFIHPVSRILHSRQRGSPRFLCKRIMSEVYVSVQWERFSHYAPCIQCFGNPSS